MPKRIPQSFIADLVARVDIVEIISNRVQLKKAGNNYQALCPFHNEKSPSFSVSPTKQFYYCFGCGAHGNAISFLMEYDRMEFLDAIETLAHNAGIEIPYEINEQQNESIKDLYEVLQQANQFYQHHLRDAKDAINYLKERGLTGEICKKYNIGYSPKGWSNLINKYSNQKQQLITSGLAIEKAPNNYDRFRERVMFPIRDVRGRVIGFGGRTLGDETPKYLNSPETPVFHKGNELYGLYEARQSNGNLPYMIIVEGYMDVIALAQHGINNAVATLGTATTSKHIQKLFRYTTKIIFCFDGDNAGKKAAWRALENTLPLMRDGVQAQFLFLPEGEDPDTQIRQEGNEEFIKRVNDATPLSEFLFNYLGQQLDLTSVADRAKMAQKTSELLKTMPQGVFKQLMYEKLANIVHMDIETLQSLQDTQIEAQNTHKKIDIAQSPSLVRTAIKLLLHHPELATCVSDPAQIANIELPNIAVLAQLLTLAHKQPDMTTGMLLEYWDDEHEAQALATLTAQELLISNDNLKSEFIGTISRLYEHGRDKTIETLMQHASQGKLSNEGKIKLQKLISDAKIKITELTTPS